jgi:hypothetical protein
MAQQPSNITKLEWITCPRCTQTFQIAIPAKASDMRVWADGDHYPPYDKYCFRVRCINPSCLQLILIETDLPLKT